MTDSLTLPDWMPWVHNGLISTQLFANQNMVGTTSQALAVMTHLWIKPGDILVDLLDALSACQDLPNGTVYTDSTKAQKCSIDDQLCLTAFSGQYARAVLDAGPDLFFWRFTAFWPTAKFSAWIDPGFYGRAAFIISMDLCMQKPFTNQDSWLQSAMMWIAYLNSPYRHGWIDSVRTDWISTLKQHGMTLKQIFDAYVALPAGSPVHPLSVLYGALDVKWGLSS